MKSLSIISYSLCVCLFLLIDQGLKAQETGSIVLGSQHELYSEVLKEKRGYWVYVPSSYADTTLRETYPVLYLLDGDLYFHIASGVVHYSKGPFKLPEMIVVGILNTDRIRDFTPSNSALDMFGNSVQGLERSGGADDFLAFVAKELIPLVEAQFRASSYRILLGHSFGGLLAGYALSQGSPLFNAYLLIDPSFWWNKAEMVKSVAQKNPDSLQGKSIYIGEADNRDQSHFDNSPHIDAIQAWREQLQFPENLSRFHYDFFEGETHASVGLLALYKGLSFVFEGYRPPDSVFSQAQYVQEHFESLSQKWKGEFLPPEGLVRNLGFGAQYGQKNFESAISFFELNVKNYPHSPHAFRLLGEAYLDWGRREKGLYYLKEALSLAPGSKLIQDKINAVTQERKP